MAGYYDEITGEYIDTGDVGQTSQLDNTSGTGDMAGWSYNNGTWTSPNGITYDVGTTGGTGITGLFNSLGGALSGKSGVGAQLASLAGVGSLLNSILGSGGGYAGYQGSVPKYTAQRTMNPIPTTVPAPTAANPQAVAPRRPGSGGITYFTPMQYLTPAQVAAQTPAATPAATATTATPVVKAAGGGMMHGGIASLGAYSDGGQLLRGPGDGVSDSIPATIGGKQPARLADGEFVIPARIVSELGNGSTDAGARKLYEMMDRVKASRKKAKNIAADTKAAKHLPA